MELTKWLRQIPARIAWFFGHEVHMENGIWKPGRRKDDRERDRGC